MKASVFFAAVCFVGCASVLVDCAWSLSCVSPQFSLSVAHPVAKPFLYYALPICTGVPVHL